jgi:hypothetical protein
MIHSPGNGKGTDQDHLASDIVKPVRFLQLRQKTEGLSKRVGVGRRSEKAPFAVRGYISARASEEIFEGHMLFAML